MTGYLAKLICQASVTKAPTMSKHEDIASELRAEIAAGRYADKGKLPSEAQLVARFGVSRPTVIQALRNLQQEELIERRVITILKLKLRKRQNNFLQILEEAK